MKRALVTGASGFIGRQLVRELLERGVETTVVVRPSSSFCPPESCRVIALEGVGEKLEARLEPLDVDVVFHLAAYGVRPGDCDVVEMLHGNVTFLVHLLHALRKSPPARFVSVGSCSEYAPVKDTRPLREDDPLDPPSLYGAAKAAAAILGTKVAHALGIPFLHLRLFGVYGPGEARERLIPHLVGHLREGRVPSLTPGEQQRDLLHVQDAVEGMIAAATSDVLDPGVYNLCSGVPVTVREVATRIGAMFGKNADQVGLGRRAYRPDEPMWVVGDASRLLRATGWCPRIPLQQGIEQTVRALFEE